MHCQLLHSLGRAAGDPMCKGECPALLALSLCDGVTRGPGPQAAVRQWAILYCGRHHCCADWAKGQKGVVRSKAPAMCSCLHTRKTRCRMQIAARWQQGTVPCCSAPCCQIVLAPRQAARLTAAGSAAPRGGASAPPTAPERGSPQPEAVAVALLMAGYPLRQLVLPVGELASLQAGGIHTASTAAAAGTAQHGRGSLAPAQQTAGPAVQRSAEGWPDNTNLMHHFAQLSAGTPQI